MAKKNNLDDILKLINQYLKLLKKNGIKFEQVYLYGSYAKGQAQEDSDIDLAIVADEWLPDKFDAQFELMKIGLKVDSRIEPHPFRKSEFDKSNPYVKEILETGKIL